MLDAALTQYAPAVYCWAVMGLLHLLQLVVVDVAGIRARHPAGSPVPADAENFLFRATRAHANTNESLCAFLLISLAAVATSSTSWAVNATAMLYTAARVGHMLCYYAGWAKLRSLMFGVGLVALILMALSLLF